MKNLLLTLFVAGAMATGCSKKDDTQAVEKKGKATIYLEVVKHNQGYPLSEAEVKLANVNDDLSIKKVFSAKTDYTGKAFFNELNEGNYIFVGTEPSYDILKSNEVKNILFTINGGENAQKTIQLGEKNCHFRLKNTSSNSYNVYVNNELPRRVLGGQTVDVSTSNGIVNVRVLQQEGYLIYPTEKTYTKNIDCTKEMEVISFP